MEQADRKVILLLTLNVKYLNLTKNVKYFSQ